MSDIYLCVAQGSVRCKYKRNIKPITSHPGCGYDGDCVAKELMQEAIDIGKSLRGK